jgi:hypothetical protein
MQFLLSVPPRPSDIIPVPKCSKVTTRMIPESFSIAKNIRLRARTQSVNGS